MTDSNRITIRSRSRKALAMAGVLAMSLGSYLIAQASGPNFNDTSNLAVSSQNASFTGNFGIGTTTPVNGTAIMNGNVGIGTWSPTAALEIIGLIKSSNSIQLAGSGDSYFNGNLGIGTSTAGRALEVSGTARMTGFEMPTGASSGYVLTSDASGVGSWAAASGGASGWTDGGTNVYTSTTTDNVGIGTTTPSTTLEIVKQGTQAPLMVSHTATGDGNILTVTSSGNIGIGTTAPRGGLIVMNGNVGIGTTSPEYPFMISRDSGGGSDTTPPELILRKAFSQDWYSPNFIGQMSDGTLASPSDVVDGWNIASFIGEGWADAQYLPFGAVSIGVDGTPGFQDAPGAVRFYTTPDGSNSYVLRMTIRNNGSVGIGTTMSTNGLTVLNGNVGIGTWSSPPNRLHVLGNIGIGTTLPYRRISAPNNGMVVEGNVGIGTWTANAGKLIVRGGNVGIGTSNPGGLLDIYTSQNTANNIRIVNENNGNAAESNLVISEVSNQAVALGYMNSGLTPVGVVQANSGLLMTWAGASNGLAIGTDASAPIVFFTGGYATASNERMRIINTGNIGIGTLTPVGGLVVMNGNVGIGTWSPTSRLQVVGTVAATAFSGDGSGLTGISAGGWTDGGTNVYTSTTTDNVGVGTTTPTAALLVQNAGTQASFRVNDAVLDSSPFVIDSAGNVGIGTSTPGYHFRVYDTGNDLVVGYFQNAGGFAEINISNSTNAIKAGVDATTGWYTVEGNLPLTLGTNSTEKMRITSPGNVGIGTTTPVGGLTVMNGNVGIGTWSPTARLQVVGSVSATSFFGDGSNLTGIAAGSSGWTDGGTNVFTSATTDNVGIGTTTPSTTLEIVQQSGRSPFMVSSTPTGNGNYMVILSDGRFGLGTTSPGDRSEFVNSQDNISYFSFANYNSGSLSSSAIQAKSDVARGYISAASSTYTYQHLAGRAGFGAGLTTLGIDIFNSNTSGDIHFISGDPSLATSIRMGIEATGNIGIGTYSSPNQLTVTGAVGIGTTLPYRLISAPNNGLTVAGNVGIGTWAASSGKLIVMGGNVGLGTVNPRGGLVVMNGNVGLGTTNPNAILQVFSGEAQYGVVIGTVSPPAVSSGPYLRVDQRIYTGDGTAALPSIAFGLSGQEDNGIFRPANNMIGFSTAGSERMRLDDLGNLGIGTTAPVGALAVMNGNVGIGTWSPTSRLQVVGTVAATAFTGDGSGLTGISAGGWTDGGTNVYTSTTTDNVAIGTTTPASALTVRGNVGIGTTTPYRTIAAPANGMIVEGNVGLGTFAAAGGKLIVMNGLVGVGTLAPGEELVVNRSQASGTVVSVLNTSGSAGGYAEFNAGSDAGNVRMGIEENGVGGAAYIWNLASSPLEFATSNTERMRITSAGSVGIGTTLPAGGTAIMNGNVGIGTWSSPQNRLHVLGNIGIGTTLPYRRISAPNNGMVVEGNVGIGTWNPTANLDVFGHMRIRTPPAGNDAFYILYPGTGTGVVSYRPDQGFSVSGTTDFSSTLLSLNRNNASGDYLQLTHTTSGDRFIVLNSGNVGIGTASPVAGLAVMNGNVGIGTWSPTARLQVVGSVSATSFFGDGSNLTGIAAGSSGWTDGGTNVYTTTTTDNVGIGTTTPSTTLEIVKQGTQVPLMVSSTATGDGDYLIVNSAGNVGIGTVSALNNKLTINGGISSVGTSAGSFVLSEQSSNGSNTVTITAPSSVTADRTCTLEDDSTPFDSCISASSAGGWTDGGTNVYTSITTDNVGIGTTTPASRLTIAGNIGIGTYAAYRTISGPNNGMIIEGNVGIGTWSPRESLEVAGGRMLLGDSSAPGTTTNKLYAVSGSLYWNGTQLSGTKIELKMEDAQFLSSNFPQFVSNGANFPVTGLAYDASTDESAFWHFKAKGYTSGNITLVLRWYADTASSSTCVWEAQIAAITPDTDSQDVETKSLATLNFVQDTHLGTTGQRVHTASITISNLDSISGDDEVWLRIARDANGTNAADGMTGDAILIGVEVQY